MPHVPVKFMVRGALMALLLSGLTATAAPPKHRFELYIPGVAPHAAMPNKYVASVFGCTGDNVSPPVMWKNAPAGTKSFVLTMFDGDRKGGPSGWWHWLVYDIPPNVTQLDAGAGVEHGTALPPGALQGRTDLGTAAYMGPCPDQGSGAHQYLFTIYALSVEKLPIAAESSGAMVTGAALDALLAKATLVIPYGR
jgi:Raf kinase inhibitor-like YbhB/YbcL family protein